MSPIPPTRNEAIGLEVVEPNENLEAQSEDVKPDTKEKDNTNVMKIIKKWKGKNWKGKNRKEMHC